MENLQDIENLECATFIHNVDDLKDIKIKIECLDENISNFNANEEDVLSLLVVKKESQELKENFSEDTDVINSANPSRINNIHQSINEESEQMPYELKGRMYYCSKCNYRTMIKKYMMRHFENLHKNAKSLFATQKHKRAVNVLEADDVYKCMHCHFLTKYKNGIILHLNMHKGKLEVPSNLNDSFYCKYCSYTSFFKKFLKEHIIKVHPDKEQYYLCKLCGKFFNTKHSRKKHINKIHTARKQFFCMHCKYYTYDIKCLEGHIACHTNSLLQLCYVCGHRTNYEHTMNVHIKKHDTTLKRYSCNKCNYECVDKSHLLKHMNNVHNTTYFSCNDCDHQSKNRKHFQIHLESHIPSWKRHKQYSCKICDYKFNYHYQLSKHMEVHQQRKVFKCDKCPKQFISKNALKNHAYIHNGSTLNCRICSFTTFKPSSLQVHEKRHLESERMFCLKCNYSSTHRGNVVEHVNKTCAKARHKGEQLKYCYHCNKASNHRSNFVKHVNDCRARLRREYQQK